MFLNEKYISMRYVLICIAIFGGVYVLYSINVVNVPISIFGYVHSVDSWSEEDVKSVLVTPGKEQNLTHAHQANQDGPTMEHEDLRRKTENTVRESWQFMQVQLKDLLQKNIAKDGVKYLLAEGAQQQRLILTELSKLQESDGYMEWREQEAENLKAIIRNRIEYIQNPKNCSAAKKLVCDMKRTAGFGSLVHDILYCLMIAYSTKRMLVVDSSKWNYSPDGWEKVYQSVSRTCQQKIKSDGLTQLWNMKKMTKNAEELDTVKIPLSSFNHPKSEPSSFFPEAIPRDLAPRLMRLHGYPFLWWESNFLSYVIRPSDRLKTTIEKTKQFHLFKSPIVGVHVRRTDKLKSDAVFHKIEEYMDIVEEYYKLLAMKRSVKEKKVYLASDDPKVLPEMQSKYPEYIIISNHDYSKSASMKTRFSERSLFGVATDMHLLSRTDYLVCTLSSNICRKAYEMMQYFFLDASERVKSLDKKYFFYGNPSNPHIVICNHTSTSPAEIDLQVGDRIQLGVLQSQSGYLKGTNLRTNESGQFPSYKAVREPLIGDFPDYSHVDKLLLT